MIRRALAHTNALQRLYLAQPNEFYISIVSDQTINRQNFFFCIIIKLIFDGKLFIVYLQQDPKHWNHKHIIRPVKLETLTLESMVSLIDLKCVLLFLIYMVFILMLGSDVGFFSNASARVAVEAAFGAFILNIITLLAFS